MYNMTEKTSITSTLSSSPPGINSHYQVIRNKLAEKMAGEITLSDKPGEGIKKMAHKF